MSSGDGDAFISRLTGGMSFDFSARDERIYIAGGRGSRQALGVGEAGGEGGRAVRQYREGSGTMEKGRVLWGEVRHRNVRQAQLGIVFSFFTHSDFYHIFPSPQ